MRVLKQTLCSMQKPWHDQNERTAFGSDIADHFRLARLARQNGNGRVEAKRLLDDGLAQFELRHVVNCRHPVAADAADLVMERFFHPFGARQKVPGPGERGGRRLMARHENRRRFVAQGN
ncbi:hypothetical protein D9M69_680030 [compost metagenome]